MKRSAQLHVRRRNRLGCAMLLLVLVFSGRVEAAISEGPKPQNEVEAQQRQKLLFDQAILSGQEKMRVAQERYDARQANRVKMLAVMAAQLQARQQTVTIQPATATPSLVIAPEQWLKPVLTALLLLVVFICARYLHTSRKREQAAAEREKLF